MGSSGSMPSFSDTSSGHSETGHRPSRRPRVKILGWAIDIGHKIGHTWTSHGSTMSVEMRGRLGTWAGRFYAQASAPDTTAQTKSSWHTTVCAQERRLSRGAPAPRLAV